MSTKTLKFASFLMIVLLTACNMDAKNGEKKEEKSEFAQITDLVLIYGGNVGRGVSWDKNHFEPYVSCTSNNKTNWLFDGFLFLELADGKGKMFATGYHGLPATKTEWKALVDYYFTEGQCVYALNDRIAEVAKTNKLPSKRKIVVAIPEPIIGGAGSHYPQVTSDYWGEVNDKPLNFKNEEDRIVACKWYIDYVESKFNEGNFENVELAGFYWLAEETLHTKTILNDIGNYLNEKKYTFNWIPYWKTNPDYYDWESLGFNKTYLQPNYFFNDKVPYSRLEDACKTAKQYNLDLELEFDMSVMGARGNRGSRLYDYMKAFRDNGVLSNKRIAYYQDCDAIYQLYKSPNEKDKVILNDFYTFVIEHANKFNK